MAQNEKKEYVGEKDIADEIKIVEEEKSTKEIYKVIAIKPTFVVMTSEDGEKTTSIKCKTSEYAIGDIVEI